MKKEFFDYDKLFESYMKAKFSGKKNVDPEQIKVQLGQLYHQWSETNLDILGGVSPSKYYQDIDDAQLLIDFLVKSCENDRRPNTFLLDKICEIPKCVPLLGQVVYSNLNSTLTLTAMELLQIMKAPQPLEQYILMLKDSFSDTELREQIIEVLIENASKIKESLFLLLPDADIELKTVIAEILINASKDERTSELLTELFIESDNIPLISAYIGRYGDEGLISLLYKALDNCNYLEFLEIKNAIERMGGIVGDSFDFSEDPLFKIISDGYKT